MVHLTAVQSSITAQGAAKVFVDTIFRLHGMPSELISDRDPRFTAAFWQSVFKRLGTRLKMSTSDHPQTDGQTERVNRVLEEILRAYAHAFQHSWSDHLSLAEFAMNNSVHASTSHTPFYVNGLRHPRVPSLLGGQTAKLTGEETPALIAQASFDAAKPRKAQRARAARLYAPEAFASGMSKLRMNLSTSGSTLNTVEPEPSSESAYAADPFPDAPLLVDKRTDLQLEDPIGSKSVFTDNLVSEVQCDGSTPTQTESEDSHLSGESDAGWQSSALHADEFVYEREAVVRFVRDSIAGAVDRQKLNADRVGRKNQLIFKIGDLVLLSTTNLPMHAVTQRGSNKLLPKYIGPFTVLSVKGDAYTLDIPSAMRLHPTFYVGRLRPYHSYGEHVSHEGAGYQLPSTPQGAADSLEGNYQDGAPHQTVDRVSPLRTRSHSSFHSSPRSGAEVQANSEGRIPPATLAIEENTSIYPPPPPPLTDSQGNQRWIVEKLLDKRVQKVGKRTAAAYLVRWRGYPPSSDSWEPESTLLSDVPDLVTDYNRQHDRHT
jgi:hypothetical protein